MKPFRAGTPMALAMAGVLAACAPGAALAETVRAKPGTAAPMLAAATPRAQRTAWQRPAGPVVIAAAPPAEFAELLRPQRTVVDVFYGGEFIVSTLAEFSPETIEFIDPVQIIDRIPNVVSRYALINHLTGPQPTNGDLICRGGQQQDCGRLATDMIGVIFDSARFRAEVFVHPDMLMVAPSTVNRYLPDPQGDELTFVQNLGAVYASGVTGQQNYSISGLTWVASGMQRVYGQWTQSDPQGFRVRELAWQRDTHEFEYIGGLFQSRADALSFSRNEYLAGGGFGRSLKTRTDLAHTQGTEIALFLPTRSQVDLYKDGRLVSTAIYNAGNVLVDTSRLPAGSYDVEIRITDAGGSVRRIDRFFVKTNRLAPKDTPLYYVEGGRIMLDAGDETLLEDGGEFQVRGGYLRRLGEQWGVNAGGAATTAQMLGEGGATWLHDRYELSGLLGLTTQGDYGVSGNVLARFGVVSVGGYYRETRLADAPGTSPDYQLMADQGTTVSANVTFPLYAGQLQLTARQNSNMTGDGEQQSVRYTQPIDLVAGTFSSFNAEIGNEDGDLYAQVGISLSGSRPNQVFGGSLQAANRETGNIDESGIAGNVYAGWRDEQLRPEQIELTARASSDLDAMTAGIDGLYASQYGRLEAAIEQVEPDIGQGGMRTSASYDTNLVARRGAGLAFGGQELAPAAVVLDLGGTGKGEFDVMVDGQRRASVRAGQPVVLPLSPYRTYRIQLVDRGLEFVAFDEGVHDVTLYPGSVQKLSWTIRPIRIALGSVVRIEQVCSQIDDACYTVGMPLRNALIKGAWGFAMTDEDGGFQVEMLADTTALEFQKNGTTCLAPFGETREVNGMIVLGELECRTAPAAAPAAASEGAEAAASGREPAPGTAAEAALLGDDGEGERAGEVAGDR